MGNSPALHRSSFCVPCPVGTFQENTGATFCHACPPNSSTRSVGSTSIHTCICKQDFYQLPTDYNNIKTCLPCPSGATCEGGTSLPLPIQGYWAPQGEINAVMKEVNESARQLTTDEISSSLEFLWEQVNSSSSFWPCYLIAACPGGVSGKN